MKLKDWFVFITLGLIWGSSFMWIKIAVQEVSPFMLVALRLLFGIIFLGGYVWLKKPSLPHNRNTWFVLITLGVINTALPFLLVSWGEIYVDSAVAAILHSTVPLFTMLIAHLTLKDDRMTFARVMGLFIGFLGVVVLMWRDLQAGVHANLLGEAAIVLASLSYAGSSVLVRANLRGVEPLIQAFFPIIVADVVMWSIIPLFNVPIVLPKLSLTWVAILWLGTVSSAFAYILYYYLLHSIGPTRTTMMTYIFPLVGVALGAIFLDEMLNWNLILGGSLVVGGIGIVNIKVRGNGKIIPNLGIDK